MDLENEEAMNFTKALIGKYMDFFAGKTKILTMVQTSMPTTLLTLKVGTTSSGMDSMVSLQIMLMVQLPWLKKKVFNQWPLNDGFYYEDKDDV